MRSLAILGAGGHGRVVADCAEAIGWDAISFFDDGATTAASGAWPILGTGADLAASLADFDGVVIGIGDNLTRLEWAARLGARAPMVSLVHPRATVSRHAVLGAGTVAFAGVVVNAGARVGQAVILNTGATVDHDCDLADGVHVSPGGHLGGNVQVGRASWIGIGAAVREGVRIGANVRVGAGAVVVNAIDDALTVVGNPARPLEKRAHA